MKSVFARTQAVLSLPIHHQTTARALRNDLIRSAILGVGRSQSSEGAGIQSGRGGTKKIHVPRWLALELWYSGWGDRKATDTIYPLIERVWVHYLRSLERKDCGPTVPKATRESTAMIKRGAVAPR